MEIYAQDFESGVVSTKFKGEASGYTWDFSRNIAKKLEFAKRQELDDADITSLKFNNGILFGLNWNDSKLYFLDDKLNVSFEWGKKGKKLTENDGILFYKFDGHKLHLYDFGSKCIKRYDLQKNKSVLEAYFPLKSKLAIYKVCHISNNTYVYVNPSDSPKGFDFVFIDSGKVIAQCPVIQIKDSNINTAFPQMVYDGNFVWNDRSSYVAYYCHFAGYFVYFDKRDLTTLHTSHTIDRTPAPIARNVEIAPNTLKLEIKPNIEFFSDAALYQDKLYLLNSINPKRQNVLDVYNLAENGKYEYSIYIPSSKEYRPISVTIDRESCYILYNDQSVVKFLIKEFTINAKI